MSRKKGNDDSSLELLLDTMCNTFGGVMFIAIALVVLMSMLSNAAHSLLEPAEKLEKLEKELTLLTQRNQVLQEALRTLENHPARARISEIMFLQKQLQAARIQEKADATRKTIEEQAMLLQKNRLNQALTLAKTRLTRRESLEKRLKELQIRSGKLGSTAASTYSMTFRVMESSFDQPYLLIVSKDRVWRLGPEKEDQAGKLLPNADCSAEKGVVEGQPVVVCRPEAGKGTPILQGDSLSPEIIHLLEKLPETRVPLFSISKDSFRSFCLLREYLTKQKIRHGINLEFDKFQSCVYRDDPEKKSYDY